MTVENISWSISTLPTSAGVEPATSWSPVGRRIQLSHRGRHSRSLIRIFTGRILDSQGCEGSSCEQRGLWSNCESAQADLNFCWAYMSERTSPDATAHMVKTAIYGGCLMLALRFRRYATPWQFWSVTMQYGRQNVLSRGEYILSNVFTQMIRTESLSKQCRLGLNFTFCVVWSALRKHAYLNILKILQPKNEKKSDKKLIFFIYLLKTQIVGTR